MRTIRTSRRCAIAMVMVLISGCSFPWDQWPVLKCDDSRDGVTFDDLSMIYVKGGELGILKGGGEKLRLVSGAYHIDCATTCPKTGRVAYAEEDRDPFRHSLVIRELSGEPKVVFESRIQIRSIAWSPDGNGLAYVTTDDVRGSISTLYICTTRADRQTRIEQFGKIDFAKMPDFVGWDVNDHRVVWSSDGKRLAWIGGGGRIVERDLASGQERVYWEASRLYGMRDDSFVAVREHPLRLVELSRESGRETRSFLIDATSTGGGFTIPDRALVCMTVNRADGRTSKLDIRSLVVDMTSGTVEATGQEHVVGVLKASVR